MKYINSKKILLSISVMFFCVAGTCDHELSDEQRYGHTIPDPHEYIAEVPEQGPYLIALDVDGYKVWGDEAVYSVSATLIYRLTFPRIGGFVSLEEEYTPTEVHSIINEQNYSQEELNTMMNRTEFPTSIIQVTSAMEFIRTSGSSEKGYIEWPKEDGSCCYRGNVIVGEGSGANTTYHIEFKSPEANFNQTYIIVNPEYPQWGLN